MTERRLPKFITCPDCEERYNDEYRRRVIDSCGHPRCFRCLCKNTPCPNCMRTRENINLFRQQISNGGDKAASFGSVNRRRSVSVTLTAEKGSRLQFDCDQNETIEEQKGKEACQERRQSLPERSMRSNNTINFADMPQGIYPRLRRPLSACLESTNSCDDSQLRQFRRTRSFSRMHPVDVKALTANKSLNKNEIKLMDRPRSLIDTGSTPSTSNSTIIAKNPKAQSLLSFDDRRESVNSVRNVKKISTASLDSIITFNQRKPLQLKKSSSLSSLSELEAEYDRTESVIEGSEVATGDFGGKNNRPKSAALTTRSNSTECSFDKEQIGQPRTGQKHADCPECSNTDVETKTSLTNNSNGRLSRSTICPKNEVTSNPNVGCKNVNINAARVESISAKNLNCGSGINSAEIGSMSDISSQFNEKRLHAKQKFTNCKDIYDPVSEKKDRSTKILCHKTENNVANSGIVPLNQTNYSDRFFHGDPLIERSFCLSEARLNESGKAPEIKPTKISGPNESSVCFSSTPNKPISFAQADNLSNGDAASGTTHIPSNSCHHNVLQSQVDESYLLDYESKSAEIRKKLTQKSFSSIQESNFLSSDDNSLKRASYPSARGPNEKVELIDPSWFKETNAYNNGPKQQSSLSNGINKAERKISFAAGYLNTEKTTYSDHAQAGKPRIKQEKLKFTEVAANAVGCRQNKKDRCMDVQFCDERLIMQDVTNTKLPPVQINTRCVRKRIDSGNLNVKSPISCGTFVKHGKFGSKKTEKQEEMNLYCNSVLTDSHISLEKEKAPRGGFTFFRKQFDKLTRWKRSASRKAPDLEEDENKRNVQNGIIYKDIDYFDEDDDEDENREEIKHDQQHVHGAKILCDFFVTDKKSVESGINDISVINGTIPKKNLSQEDEPLKDLIDEKYRDADLSSDPSTQISKNLCLFNAAEETSVHSLPDSISYRTEFKHRLGLALHSGSENTLTNVTDASLNTSQQHVNQLSEIDELSSFDSESQNTLFTLSSSDSTSVLTNYDSGDNMLQCPYFHDRSSTALSFHSYSSYDESSFLSSTTASSVTSVNASAEESDFHEALQKRRMERELQVLLERKLTRRRQGLEEIEFKTLCQQLPKNQFASRDWLFERLYEHLLSDDRRTSLHGVVVTGRTGCGKSVLIQELLWPRYFPCAQESRKDIFRQQITKSILVHHICSTSNKQTLSLSGYVLNLAAVLINCKHFERYAKFLLQRRDIANLLSREAIEQDPSFALTEGITKPLKNLCDKLIYTPEQFLIVIDVCEQPCHDVETESISSFLAKHLHQFPSWCKFLIAGSEKSLGDIINRGNFQWIKLDDISSWDIQRDIYGFTEMCCKRFPELHKTLTQRERGELIEVVVRGSLGSFTHANLLLCFLQSNLNTQPRTTTYTLIEELDDLLMIIFRREFCGSERSRILTLGLLEASCVSEDFLTDTQLYRVVESGCSSHSITQEEYCNCIEKLIAVQILGKSVDDKIFVTDSARNWLCKRGVAEMGFNLKNGHNLLCLYLMKSAEGENGQDMLKFAHHLALSSFGEDIADIEERVGFRAWTFSHVFRSSTVGFMEPSNIFRPDPDVYHLFLHTDVNFSLVQHRYGNNPLVLAASLNQPKIIQLLVSHQIISPHLLNEALQVGAKLGHYGVVKSLLESGVDVSRLDETGKSIFQLALEHGRLEIAGLLMDADWPIDREHVRKEAAQSALCEACSKGMRGIVSDLLLEENLVHVNETDKHGKLPIVCAAKGGHLSVVRLLLSKGTSFEMKDEEHKTPLIAAVENNHQEIVEFLINEGADVDEVDSNGRTPLIISASEGYDQMVEVLIMEDSDVNHEDDEGLTAIAWACRRGCLTTLRTLLRHGSNIESADKLNRTPLHHACANGSTTIIKTLLEHKANTEHKDNDGLRSLERALIDGKTGSATLLMKRGVQLGNTCWTLAEQNLEIFCTLVNFFVDKGDKMVSERRFKEANSYFQKALDRIYDSVHQKESKIIELRQILQQSLCMKV